MTFERIKLTRAQKDKFGKIRRLDQLQNLDPVEFELFCGYLYERRGYQAHMTATSGDEGIDLLLIKGGKKEVVQCKRYQGSVGQPVVRDIYGTMLHTDSVAAAIVTTGRFTKAAEAWAANKPIELIGRHELMSWVNRERRTNGMDGSWFSSNVGKLSIVILALVVLGLCLYSLQLGVQTFEERTARSDATPRLEVPTVPATQAPVVVVTPAADETDEADDATTSAEIAPTSTLRPTATAPAGSIKANFEAAPVDQFRLTTNAADWEALTPIVPIHIVEQENTWNGSMDVSAAFRFAYDADNLYGYVMVADDTHVQVNGARQGYLGDSIELEIDTLGDKASQAQQDDYQYIISPGDFGTRPAEAFRFRGNGSVMTDDWGTRAQVVSERTETGYVMAFQIPWFDLRIARNQIPGTTFGMTLNVNDNDDAGTSKQELMISNVAGRRWSQPNTWGSMTLGE